jgi:hypothetical protein
MIIDYQLILVTCQSYRGISLDRKHATAQQYLLEDKAKLQQNHMGCKHDILLAVEECLGED